jgi:uncharacterized protein (DUF2235 family)
VKRIILLSDGTGNSSAKLFKTNVWRLYQSLDLSPTTTDTPQIACYNDGVGTSSFKPLAVLGGVFGYGLKRNILHLYDFLCEHWQEGDEIYLFGFSRGSYTVRMLAGLIAKEGLLPNVSGAELSYATRDIYRRYRLPSTRVSKSQVVPTISDPWIVRPFRAARKTMIRMWRTLMHQAKYPPKELIPVDHIRFVGVWDTVAAYGSPLAELTLGIDKYIFPLSMPDRKLSPKIQVARHALALDDERDTFHPLLWDECDSERPERIKQVWFAGMHSDVGGGYPDDGLSYPPLEWMMDEAAAAGLVFLPGAKERFAPPPNRSAPLHDSRKGLAGYYRYQPRRLDVYLKPPPPAKPPPEAIVMVDPRPRATAHLREVHLHESVLQRMREPASRYAPIVLPADVVFVGNKGAPVANPASAAANAARVAGQQAVWDDVWQKRVTYGATVAVSLTLATMPIWASSAAAGSCVAFYCSIAPLIHLVSNLVPVAFQFWTDAFATHAGSFLVLVGLLVGLLLRSAALQQRIRDRMLPLLDGFKGKSVTVKPRPASTVQRLRTAAGYLATVAYLKWRVLPFLWGIGGLFALLLIAILTFGLPTLRWRIDAAEANGHLCRYAKPDPLSGPFRTNNPCWNSGKPVEAGAKYEVALAVTDDWFDDTIPAGPLGYPDADQPWLVGYGARPFLRAIGGIWFQPFVTIISPGGAKSVQPLEFTSDGSRFIARLSPARSGTAFIWVNDAVFPFWPREKWTGRYGNNRGSAAITITELPKRTAP